MFDLLASINDQRRDTLTELISVYVSRLLDAVADLELSKVRGERFNGLHFAWAGTTLPGEPNYYRTQSAGLVIESDSNQSQSQSLA